jgi:hypothetical protein
MYSSMPRSAEDGNVRRIAVIDPATQSVIYKHVAEREISRAAGPALTGHHIFRHETSYGLFYDTAMVLNAFSLEGQLFYGAAVLYAFDAEGRTVNMPCDHPQPQWLMFGDAEP